MNLDGNIAIVTGASRGIGKAIALALAEAGSNVIVTARSEVEGRLPGTIHQTVEEIQALGGRALAVKTDVTKEAEINEMVRTVLERYGNIDILVNNAGIAIPGILTEVSTKRWDLVMGVNLRGTFLCTKAILPSMIARRSGSIINLSSILGTRVMDGGIPYGATKAAIERFTVGLAEEVREYNIAVNALCPGYTDTEGLRMLSSPNMDYSSLQRVETWGRYAVFLAQQDGNSLTGKCLTAEEFEELISQTQYMT